MPSYPSWLREQSAKLLFIGSNPIDGLNLERKIMDNLVALFETQFQKAFDNIKAGNFENIECDDNYWAGVYMGLEKAVDIIEETNESLLKSKINMLTSNIKDIDPEYIKIVDDNFESMLL